MTDCVSIFCDGGSRGNPGPAASAFLVYRNSKIIFQSVRKIGNTTNNVAEYSAVYDALLWFQQSPIFDDVSLLNFYLDSELVVRQLTGQYRIKDIKLKTLVIKIKNLEKEIKKKIFYRNIPREKNNLADGLVKNSLSKP